MTAQREIPSHVVIAVCLAIAVARIAMVEGAFSDNDRSRWATIRALAERDTFAIGTRAIEGGAVVDRGIVTTPGWTSVDVVLDPATQLFYSSKPPLLAYLASFPVKACIAAGFTLEAHRPFVTRVVLVLFQLLPFALALVAVHRLLRARRRSDDPHDAWLRACALATVGVASLFATFIVTLNPHVIAGSAAVIALWLLDDHAREPSARARPLRLAAAGMFAGAAAAFEPTALAFLALLFALALHASLLAAPHPSSHARVATRHAFARVIVFFGVAAALPIGLHLVTTAAVFGDALHFTGPTQNWYRFEGSYWQKPTGIDVDDASSVLGYAFHLTFGHHGLFSITPALLVGVVGLALRAQVSAAALACALVSFVAARFLEVTLDTSWQAALVPPSLVAAWIALPMVRDAFASRDRPEPASASTSFASTSFASTSFASTSFASTSFPPRAVLAAATMSIGFYVMFTSGYGGVALGARWLAWLVPLLALGVPDAIARVPRRLRGLVAMLTLATGVVLATPPGGLNPWQSPRLFSAPSTERTR